MVERKMSAVMRIFRSQHVSRIVLGAWGCGAYCNPVRQIASLWRKILLGDVICDSTAENRATVKEYEPWGGAKEVIFAISDRRMAEEFAKCFGIELELQYEPEDADGADNEEIDKNDEFMQELKSRIAELEIQITQARTEVLRSRLEEILASLQRQLNDRNKEEKPASQGSCNLGDEDLDQDS